MSNRLEIFGANKTVPKEKNMIHYNQCTSWWIRQTYRPKFYEVLKICSSYKKAVEEGICQEQHEKLVVGESHTVIHPATRVAGQCGKNY